MSDVLDIQASPATQVCRTVSRARFLVYFELIKPRITGMVLAATSLGFYLAWPANFDATALMLLLHALLGTALVGGGANALNQYMEADRDGRMERTRRRPLPSGAMTAGEVLMFALALSAAGLMYLALFAGVKCSVVAGAALLGYVCVYTPLKPHTPLSVFVGAVPGALPPVIGWTAATDAWSRPAWLMFAILFFWQLPHFASIAWLYRADYERGGFSVLSVLDPDGSRTTVQMITHTLALILASLLPVFYGLCGPMYAVSATMLGLGFLACGFYFFSRRTSAAARLHLRASVIYLPVLIAFMMIDKVSPPV